MAVPDLTRLLTGFQGSLIINPTTLTFPVPPSPTLVAEGSGFTITPGVHQLLFAYLGGPNVVAGPPSSVTILPGQRIRWSADVPSIGVFTGVQIYMTKAGGSMFYAVGGPQGVGPNISGTFSFNSDNFLVTPLTQTVNYGGTVLGEVMDTIVTPRRLTKELTAEEFGPETIEVVDAGESWKLTCALRGVDPDAYALVMSIPAAAGAVSGRPLVTYPGSKTQAGAFLTQRANMPMQMLLVPKDSARLPSFIFYAAIPVLDASARLSLQLDREGTLGAVFHCLRANATGQPRDKQVVQWGMLEDMSLT